MLKIALFCVVFGFFHLQGRGNPPDPKYYNKYCSPRGQELCSKVSEKPWIWTVAPSHTVPLKKGVNGLQLCPEVKAKTVSFKTILVSGLLYYRSACLENEPFRYYYIQTQIHPARRLLGFYLYCYYQSLTGGKPILLMLFSWGTWV